jgi:hypothetical protein
MKYSLEDSQEAWSTLAVTDRCDAQGWELTLRYIPARRMRIIKATSARDGYYPRLILLCTDADVRGSGR